MGGCPLVLECSLALLGSSRVQSRRYCEHPQCCSSFVCSAPTSCCNCTAMQSEHQNSAECEWITPPCQVEGLVPFIHPEEIHHYDAEPRRHDDRPVPADSRTRGQVTELRHSSMQDWTSGPNALAWIVSNPKVPKRAFWNEKPQHIDTCTLRRTLTHGIPTAEAVTSSRPDSRGTFRRTICYEACQISSEPVNLCCACSSAGCH